MPRKAKSHTLVFLNHGALDHESFDDVDKLRAKLAEIDDPKSVVVFGADPMPFSVSRDPVVTLGKPTAQKERKARKPRAPKAAKPTGETVTADFFEKPTNGTAATTAPPEPAPTEAQG